MCGIVGYIALGSADPSFGRRLAAMVETLVHRGPDAQGYFDDGQVGFGFRRLSIIDLAGGNQPMTSADGTVVLICNGEIFNYDELRRDVESHGYSLRSDCDVEVLIPLYQIYGREFLDRLNGQFSFALFDRRSGAVLLARDAFGIIPLFFKRDTGVLWFASEIKAILAATGERPSIEPLGLDQVIALPGLVSPVTMFRGIHSLPPGTRMLVADGVVRQERYWDLDYAVDPGPTDPRRESDWVEAGRELFVQAVRRRLRADVPIGYYVSGGLDSSLIAGVIHHLGGGERHSFSIDFTRDDLSERGFQQKMLRRAPSIHHEITIGPVEIAERLREVIRHCECPVKESYNACSLAMAEAASGSGVRVVLTGEGSDELFGGYIGYRFDAARPAGRRRELVSLRQALEEADRLRMWADSEFTYEHDFADLRAVREGLYTPWLRERLGDVGCFTEGLVDRSKLVGRHVLHRRSYLDAKLRLADHLLGDHGDRMAMARSVEARYPFLDRDFVEFARRVPVQLKVNGGSEKYLVKEIARPFVPAEIIEREKFAFRGPGSADIVRLCSEWVHDITARDTVRAQGCFDPDAVEYLKAACFDPTRARDSSFEIDLLMVVITFGVFMETFQATSTS